MTPEHQDQLKRLVDRAVRDLPRRPAPNTLETRVQAELSRRAALPWWRKSFGHWPLAAQVVLAIVCLAAAKFVMTAIVWASSGWKIATLRTTFAAEIHWSEVAIGLAKTAMDITTAMIGAIPSWCLYGSAALIVALYVALFGLGAAAYRTLYANN